MSNNNSNNQDILYKQIFQSTDGCNIYRYNNTSNYLRSLTKKNILAYSNKCCSTYCHLNSHTWEPYSVEIVFPQQCNITLNNMTFLKELYFDLYLGQILILHIPFQFLIDYTEPIR
jgi:hypothetical protein